MKNKELQELLQQFPDDVDIMGLTYRYLGVYKDKHTVQSIAYINFDTKEIEFNQKDYKEKK